jgi:hypothetical protein
MWCIRAVLCQSRGRCYLPTSQGRGGRHGCDCCIRYAWPFRPYGRSWFGRLGLVGVLAVPVHGPPGLVALATPQPRRQISPRRAALLYLRELVPAVDHAGTDEELPLSQRSANSTIPWSRGGRASSCLQDSAGDHRASPPGAARPDADNPQGR